jgi:molybdate transport system substrate-binding protein
MILDYRLWQHFAGARMLVSIQIVARALRKCEGIVNRKIILAIAVVLSILILSAGLLSMFARKTPAQTTELHVMISDGMKTVVEEVTPQIERATGRKLAAQFNSSKNLRDKIQAGEPFDAAILTSDVLDDLIKQGKIAAGTRADISRTGLGMGVRAGAPKPEIATPEALKQTLLSAKSISFNPTGASAAHTYDMFARLGITDAVNSKLMLDAEAGRPQMNVAGGKAELVISLIPEIKFFPGVDLVGPILAEFQSYVNFSGGIATNAREPQAANALLQFITGAGVVPILKAKGMEPQSH